MTKAKGEPLREDPAESHIVSDFAADEEEEEEEKKRV